MITSLATVSNDSVLRDDEPIAEQTADDFTALEWWMRQQEYLSA